MSCIVDYIILKFALIGFCEQSISNTDYIITYDTTPSYTHSTATLSCTKGYVAMEPGYAVCGSDGQWIIEYPECQGMYVCICTHTCFLSFSMIVLNSKD